MSGLCAERGDSRDLECEIGGWDLARSFQERAEKPDQSRFLRPEMEDLEQIANGH